MYLFFDLTHFIELGQNYRNILVRFLVQIKNLKFASEIKWPLVRTCFQRHSKSQNKKTSGTNLKHWNSGFFRFAKKAHWSKSFDSILWSLKFGCLTSKKRSLMWRNCSKTLLGICNPMKEQFSQFIKTFWKHNRYSF